MRTLNKNKQKMFFSNYIDSQVIYERDSDGNIIYDTYIDDDGVEQSIPREIGSVDNAYSTPQEFYTNLSMSGGEAEAVEFGVDVSQYEATIVVDKGAYNIDESSLIWHRNSVGYKDIEQTEIEPNSADYRVIKVSESLNYNKYILGKVVDNG